MPDEPFSGHPLVSGVTAAPVASLRPWHENPRTISAARRAELKQSMIEDPEMLLARPLIAQRDGEVLLGNQRFDVAVELEWKTVPVIWVNLSPERARMWALRDNNAYGDWDETALAEMLAELAADGVDLALTGFASHDVDRILADIELPADPDDAPPLPQGPADSQPGEVYELGSHRLLCGDATDRAALSRFFGETVAEVLWTDPPYGVDYVGKTRRKLRIQNDSGEAHTMFAAAIAAADTVLAPSARFYICVPGGPLGTGFRLAVDAQGWRLHQTLVWAKQQFVLGHGDHQLQHEDVLYGYKPGPGRPGRGRHKGSRWQGGNNVSSVFFVDRPTRSESHPTIKPVGLIAAHIANSTVRGDVVLDTFAGSGSTLIACEQLGRRCFAVEIDPAYCDVIRHRYKDFTGG